MGDAPPAGATPDSQTPFGSRETFHAAFAELYPRLVSYARRYGATFPEDIAQEAFVILMQRENPVEHPTAFLYGTVRTLALTERRPMKNQNLSLEKNNVSCIVLTIDDKPHGIVTERDLLSKVIIPNKKSSELMAKEIMTSPIISVLPRTPADDIAQKMINNKIRRVVVIDDGHPIGIITVTDFVKHLNTIWPDAETSRAELYQNLIDECEYWNN